jgi:hypothetical protein
MSRKAAFHPASISVVIERFPDVGIGVDHMPTAELETTAAGHFKHTMTPTSTAARQGSVSSRRPGAR